MSFFSSLISRSVNWRTDNVYAINIHNIPEDRRNILENMNLQHRRCENFAGYNVLLVCHMTVALMIT